MPSRDDESRKRTGQFHCCRWVGRNFLLCKPQLPGNPPNSNPPPNPTSSDGHVDTSFPFQAIVGPDFGCAVVTYGLVAGGAYFINLIVLSQLSFSPIAQVIQYTLMAATLTCFTFAACSDPGIVFQELYDTAPPDVDLEDKTRMPKKTKCSFCNVYRLPSAHHCYDCDVCVTDLDHHCPWTGKCIGKRNLSFFYGFLTCLTLLIFFSAICGALVAGGISTGGSYDYVPAVNITTVENDT